MAGFGATTGGSSAAWWRELGMEGTEELNLSRAGGQRSLAHYEEREDLFRIKA